MTPLQRIPWASCGGPVFRPLARQFLKKNERDVCESRLFGHLWGRPPQNCPEKPGLGFVFIFFGFWKPALGTHLLGPIAGGRDGGLGEPQGVRKLHDAPAAPIPASIGDGTAVAVRCTAWKCWVVVVALVFDV